jgi:hypothetical protein
MWPEEGGLGEALGCNPGWLAVEVDEVSAALLG